MMSRPERLMTGDDYLKEETLYIYRRHYTLLVLTPLRVTHLGVPDPSRCYSLNVTRAPL